MLTIVDDPLRCAALLRSVQAVARFAIRMDRTAGARKVSYANPL